MEQCTGYFHQMQDLRRGDLDDEQQRQLFAHLAECDDCRDLLSFHDRLAAAGTDEDEPAAEELASMRAAVIHRIRNRSGGWRGAPFAAPGWRRGQWFLAAAAGLVVAVLAGFAAGRFASPYSNGGVLLAELESSARTHHRLSQVDDAPNMLANVSVRPLGEDQVTLAFDVVRHVEVTRSTDDPLVEEVLVRALVDQASLGSRLRAVSLAAQTPAPKLAEALIFAMLNDPELAVRLRALEVLGAQPPSAAVHEALIQVLRQDEAVQMRLLAVESLASGGLETERLRETMGPDWHQRDPAVAVRLASLVES